MFLAGHIVAMVTYSVPKIIPTCSPVIGQFFDAMIVASIDKEYYIGLRIQVQYSIWEMLSPQVNLAWYRVLKGPGKPGKFWIFWHFLGLKI